jgi:exo-beta-1,3-glucanase (GH17 family)
MVSGWLVGAALLLSLALPAAAAAAAPAFLSYLEGNPAAAMVAFNPSRFDPGRPVGREPYPAAELAADLATLRPAFDGLILYSFRADLTPSLVAAARDQGFRALLLGIWDVRSEAEIAGTAELIRRYHRDLALAVAIGNEGLNDNRYGLVNLHAARERLAALLPPDADIPLTTSEPFGDYGFAPLRAFGDFLAPNIHPAIDQEGIAPEAGAQWVRGRALALAGVAGKPVLVKETGLPNGGGGRHSPETQAAFWRAYLDPGRVLHLPARPSGWVSLAAAFEAFDAPWKAAKTGIPMEGRWGLMSVERIPYPAFSVWRQANTGQ